MPAPPEFGYTSRNVGIIEVFGDLEPEHTPQPYSHVGIARKIEIYVECVEHHRRPGAQHAAAELVLRGKKLRRSGGAVAQHQLFRKSADEPVHPRGESGNAFLPPGKLGADLLVTHYRSGDKLREQRYVGAERHESARLFHFAAVKVDRIRHYLESIERYPHREREPGDPFCAEQRREEVEVFKKQQERQVHRKREGKKNFRLFNVGFAVFVYPEPERVRRCDRDQHKRDIRRLPPAVERQRQHKKDRVSPPDRNGVIYCQRYGQIDEDENERGEDHRR